MRTLAELAKDELKSAIMTHVANDGPLEGSLLPYRVARSLGSDINDIAALGVREVYGYPAQQKRERFGGRVYRAAAELAGEGKLRKVGKGEYKPGGALAGKSSYYYTPGQWDEAVTTADKRKDGIAEMRHRWEDIRARLKAGPGVTLTDDQHKLSLGDWETLLNSAGW